MAKKICVYLDYATIPSLNYFLHFAENSDDKETIRLFGLGRFTVPESIIKKYPSDIIQFYSTKNNHISLLVGKFEEIISNNQNDKWEVEIHLNLMHYLIFLIPFFEKYLKYRNNIECFKLNFYDDGSEGIVNLSKIYELDNLPELILKEKEQMQSLITKCHLNCNILTRYFWGEIFPAKYYIFNSKLLESDRLSSLKDAIGDYEKIDFGRFNKLSKEKQSLVLEFLNIDIEKLNRLKSKLSSKPSFLFVGTTLHAVVEENKQWLHRFHFEMIKQCCIENGIFFHDKRDFNFFYKGHPNEIELNDKIIKEFDFIEEYPMDIPFEIFFLLGLIPDKVGGFASSILLNFPKECIEDVIFISSQDGREDNIIYSSQYRLMNSLIELDYLDQVKSHLHIDIIRKLKKEDYDVRLK